MTRMLLATISNTQDMLAIRPLLDDREFGSQTPGTGYFYTTVMRMEALGHGYYRLDILSGYMTLAGDLQLDIVCCCVWLWFL